MVLLLGFALIIIGLILLIFPKLFYEIWTIINGWRLGSSIYETGPKKFIIISSKVNGILLMIIGIGLIIIYIY